MSDLLTDAANATRLVDASRVLRDAAICDAYNAGHGLREIGRAVGMSPTGIRKIVDRHGLPAAEVAVVNGEDT